MAVLLLPKHFMIFSQNPQDLYTLLYQRSKDSLNDNPPFMDMVCTTIKQTNVSAPDLSDFDTRAILKYAVNFAAVLETLIMYMEHNLSLLFTTI
jgi:hypothetical protein